MGLKAIKLLSVRTAAVQEHKAAAPHLTRLSIRSRKNPIVFHSVRLFGLCTMSAVGQPMKIPSSESSRFLFRQLFDKQSSTYTYILADTTLPEKPAVVRPYSPLTRGETDRMTPLHLMVNELV